MLKQKTSKGGNIIKSIALIHTVKSVAVSFDERLQSSIDEEVKIYNIWDDFLAINPNEVGEFTIDNRNRLFLDIKNELAGVDMIVTTCSTLTPVVEMIRPFIKVPVIAIDDEMARLAVTFGQKVLIMATAESTIEPTKSKITKEAKKANVKVDLSTKVCHEAFHAMKVMDMEKHDRLLKEMAKEVKGYDCIVLAQASMAHLEEDIHNICGCPVLSSPDLCIKEVNGLLKTIK